MQLYCAKMAEWIEVLFRVENPEGPRNAVLYGGPNLATAKGRGEGKMLPTASYINMAIPTNLH